MSVEQQAQGEDAALPAPSLVEIVTRDGTRISAAVYLPAHEGRHPVLLAASPYRHDNNVVRAAAVFPWRETGPIGFYLLRGYAFVHMDVRGTGRSGGEYRYMCRGEQQDLYDVIEWVARQPWSTGKVGGIGQSYYARMQWFMGIENPPALACIAPYDGNVDTYRASAYSGGIPGEYPAFWFNSVVRTVNQYPAQGPSRLVEGDYANEVRRHPFYDDYWKERSAAERLECIRVPVLSIGVWSKMDLHLNGNIIGYQRAGSAKKLLVLDASDVAAAVADYSSEAFHARYLLPFYDTYLKGLGTGYEEEAPVRFFTTGRRQMKTASDWPPTGLQAQTIFLSPVRSETVISLNDGSLSATPPSEASCTRFDYPNIAWRRGALGLDAKGRPDPLRFTLTFTSEPLEKDLLVVGPVALNLFVSSSNTDTQFVVKMSEQFSTEPRASADEQPRFGVVGKGWLKASHREIDADLSRDNAPWYTHSQGRPLVPGKIEHLQIALMPIAHWFRKGSRIQLHIANCDSSVTDGPFHHAYAPQMVGTDFIHFGAENASCLRFSVSE